MDGIYGRDACMDRPADHWPECISSIVLRLRGEYQDVRVLPHIVGRSERKAEAYALDQMYRTRKPEDMLRPRPASKQQRTPTPPLQMVEPRAVEGVDYSRHYYDPTKQTRRNVNRNSTLSQDFFTDGMGRFVSRPLVGGLNSF